MKNYDITAVGECLIDFVSLPSGEPDRVVLQGNPGGAPANFLAAAAKQGLRTAFIGKVGEDTFGTFLKRTLERCGIDVSGLIQAPQPTTLAIVGIDGAGERSFSFYRNQTADVMLRAQDIPQELLQESKVLHFGSVSMTTEPSRSATLYAAREAKRAGALISFDPNLRPALWPSLDEAREQICLGLEIADCVKLSHEEFVFLTDKTNPLLSGKLLMDSFALQFLAVTCGENGSILFTKNCTAVHPGYSVDCKDATGAGDAFWGAALSWLLKKVAAPEELGQSDLEELSAFANAAGAITTTRSGAIPAIPDTREIMALIGQRM